MLGGKEDEVAKHEVFNLVEVAGSQLSLQCRLLRRSGDRFVLERIVLLDKSYWRNLRVPIRFASFIYPLPGAQWQGRRAISQILRRNDLSGERCLYAAKFIEMCHAEETFVREAVFRVQLRSRPRKDSANENTKGEQV